jgi:hypothetical protein
MTNYSVPFDYDGKKFLWVEFLSEKERNLCVYFFETKGYFKHKLHKEFGHISHCRLIGGNKIILVRLQNIVEIREISDFKLLRTFTNIGEEVIALDVYLNQSKIMLQEPLHEVNLNHNLNMNSNSLQQKDPQYLKIDNIKKDHVSLGINEENVFNEENLSVVLLDIDGNVNVWENFNVSTKLNLYNLNDMGEEYKNKQFFSMGYPYYIKMNANYFAISTDHGVFVIKKPEN